METFLITQIRKLLTIPTIASLAVFSFGHLAAQEKADAFSSDAICDLYKKAKLAEDFKDNVQRDFAERILAACHYTKESLLSGTRPLKNFRATCPQSGGDETSCRLFRGGEPAEKVKTESLLEHYRADMFGFDFASARSVFKIDDVLDLRFDPSFADYKTTFGAAVPEVPLSPGEQIFRYGMEKDLVQRQGMNSIYLPSIPESEHLMGFFEKEKTATAVLIPKMMNQKNPRPYLCRLPSHLEGEKFASLEKSITTLEGNKARPLHWMDDVEIFRKHLDEFEAQNIYPLLASEFADCHDWNARYGEEVVKKWGYENAQFSHISNQVFIRIARHLVQEAAKGRRILYHCSSGTDRVGRVSMNIELLEYNISAEEIRAYKGPLSNSRIDLIVLNYLLSKNAGSSPVFTNIFPDLQHPEYSWLMEGLEPIDPHLNIPILSSRGL